LPDLIVTDLTEQSEILTDYKISSRKQVVNGEYSLPFLVYKTSRNEYAFDLVQEESIVEYDGQKYRIKKIREYMVGQTYVKEAQTVNHVFFDILDDYQYETISGKLNMVQVLNHVFSVTDWTWVEAGAFNSVVFDKFGNGNALALFQTILERFGAEFEITGKREVTLKNQIGQLRDAQFRYRHNIKTLYKDIDTSNLSTYIKGYGKPYDNKEILDSNKNYDSITGNWICTTDPDHYTINVGDKITVTFTGTGCTFQHYADSAGGVWDFIVDDKANSSVKISTWSATPQIKTDDLFHNLDPGQHTVIGTFKGDDSKHTPSTGKNNSRGYVRHSNTDSEKTFGIYRERVGDELYTCVTDYTSPNSAVYGIRHAPPVQDNSISDQASLLDELKKTIQDTPAITIEVEIVELVNQGIPIYDYDLGDTIYLIHEDLGIDAIVRIMQYTDYPGTFKSPTVVLSNYKKFMAKTLASFQQTSKTVKQLTDVDGNLSLALKRLYRNSNHYSDSTGDWYISPDDPNAFVHVGAGGIDCHKGLFRAEREDGYAQIVGGTIQHGFAIQGSEPAFQTTGVGKQGQFYTSSTDNRVENVQRFTFKHDSRYIHIVCNMFCDAGEEYGNVGNMAFDVMSDDETITYTSAIVTENRWGDINQGFQGYRKDILLDLGTPDGDLKVIYWRIFSSIPNWNTYGSIRYIVQEG
jgi:hypothetical protein